MSGFYMAVLIVSSVSTGIKQKDSLIQTYLDPKTPRAGEGFRLGKASGDCLDKEEGPTSPASGPGISGSSKGLQRSFQKLLLTNEPQTRDQQAKSGPVPRSRLGTANVSAPGKPRAVIPSTTTTINAVTTAATTITITTTITATTTATAATTTAAAATTITTATNHRCHHHHHNYHHDHHNHRQHHKHQHLTTTMTTTITAAITIITATTTTAATVTTTTTTIAATITIITTTTTSTINIIFINVTVTTLLSSGSEQSSPVTHREEPSQLPSLEKPLALEKLSPLTLPPSVLGHWDRSRPNRPQTLRRNSSIH
ncbi:Histatin-1 [Manis pentadactyla]|nr:Histatin-1 [Manis pentadactyla]